MSNVGSGCKHGECAEGRVCYKCRETKPLTEFHKDRTKTLGRDYCCKVCKNNRHAPRKKRQYLSEFERLLRKKIYNTIHTNVRRGTLIKPSVCSKCNHSNKYIEAHHYDYSKPLDITWPCKSCHLEIHKCESQILVKVI
jgi:hypothetical protein